MSKKSYYELSRIGKYKYIKDLEKKTIAHEKVEAGSSQFRPTKVPRLNDGSRVTQLEREGAECFDDQILNTSTSEEELSGDEYSFVVDDDEENLAEGQDEQNDDPEDDEGNLIEERDEQNDEIGDTADDEEEEENEAIGEESVDDEDDGADDAREQPQPPPINNNNRPLYTGASITVAESMLLILTLLLKHNITGSCLSDIITVINFHCLRQGFKNNSLYKFRKYFSMSEKKFNKHFYCSICQSSLESENAMCGNCNERKGVSYFIEMPFLKQLGEMFKREGFYQLLQHRFHRQGVTPDSICDIYDGSLYKRYEATGFLSNRNNISLMWYTDGVPVFKSSKVSMWPVFLTINELPYKYRMKRENTMLAGLWFGNKKPAANHFIYKLRSDFAELFQGTAYTLPGGHVINIRGILLAGTCDLPAKADFLNMMAHNGQFGCPNCKNSGETFTHATGGTSRVYSYENEPEMRTTAETNENADQALLSRRPVHGVKGPCSLSRLMPDFIEGVAIDYMHGIFCGVTKRLLSLWFDSAFSGRPFSLSTVSAIINEKLLKIKPPKWVHRLPRSVEDFIHWKASELRMWFFYYSLPVLEGIMRPDYLEHYVCLVTAIAFLDSEHITRQQLDTAKSLLHKFVREFQNLYDLQFCTINIHQLLHLPVCVERLGPLWVYSCFPFEDLNGKLLRLVHGTSHIESQIASAHTYLLKMKCKLDELPEGPIRDFAIGVKRQVKICQRVFDCCYSVGTYKKYITIPNFLAHAMRNSNIPLGNVQSYTRLLKDSKLIIGESYPRRLRTSSSHVLYRGPNGDKMLGTVHNFIKVSYCDCVKECFCEGQHYAVATQILETDSFQVTGDDGVRSELFYLHKFHRTDNTLLLPVVALESVCVFMSIDNNLFIGMPINCMELE